MANFPLTRVLASAFTNRRFPFVTAEPLPTPERFWLTPRYVVNRIGDLLYQRTHPGDPWLTADSIKLLDTLLRPADRGVEFGSGRSTLWFAPRVATLTSIETNTQWHEKVTGQLKDRDVSNVEYILIPVDQPTECGDGPTAQIASAFPDASFDFALVDSYYRDHTAKAIMPKVKPGGMLIIDNINWHLPCGSKAPGTRPAELGPATAAWAEVGRELAGWRTIWTTNGVWDTAIFFRPLDR
jgi:predicted O-methyltransferase YrrM